jgi:hypothetical protein
VWVIFLGWVEEGNINQGGGEARVWNEGAFKIRECSVQTNIGIWSKSE